MNDLYEIVSCPVCEDAPHKLWLDDGQPTKYQRCQGCGTVYASPRAPHATRYAWLNDTFALTEDVLALTESRRPALALEAEIIHRQVAGGRMLDVGCSIGALFEFFSNQSWERHGVELSPSAAEYAAKVYAAQVHTGTLSSAKYPEGYFDLVTLIDTLYYLDDPVGELQEIRRMLKPGGFLAIEIAGKEYMLKRNYGLIPWLLDKRWSRASTDSSYIYWFGPEGLARLLKKCNLRAVTWDVVPSPVHSNKLVNAITSAHFHFMSWLSHFSIQTLTWAPKYLCLAQAV